MTTLKNYKTVLIAALICVIAFLIRFSHLTSSPEGLYIDETSIGYNAYALLTTGKDEHARSWPLFFEAFGEWKLPVYIYSVFFAQLIIGPNDLAVRLPSVLFGTFTVLSAMLLAYEMGYIFNLKHPRILVLVTGILGCFSPWLYLFNRPGHEASSALFFQITGIWLFFYSVRKKSFWLLLCSFLSLALTVYSYNSSRIVSAVIAVYLFVFYIRTFSFKTWLVVLALSIIFLSPFIQFSFSPAGLVRFRQVSIVTGFNQESFQKVATNFWLNSSLETLFIKGDFYDKKPDEFGLLHLIELPFFVLGFLYLLYSLRHKQSWKAALLIVLVFFVSFVPGALTNPAPLALRTMLAVSSTLLFSALGFSWVYVFLSGKKSKIFLISFLVILIVSEFQFLKFYHLGYVQSSSERVWQTSQKKALTRLTHTFLAQPVIYVQGIRDINMAWYLKCNPRYFIERICIDENGREVLAVDSIQALPVSESYIFLGLDKIPGATIIEVVKTAAGSDRYYLQSFTPAYSLHNN